jgi:topoisomerase-4 subunit B
MATENYNEDSIRSLDWKEHIRLRPGMYIGKMGMALLQMMAYIFY